jgi:hypothetical protein
MRSGMACFLWQKGFAGRKPQKKVGIFLKNFGKTTCKMDLVPV